MQEFSQNPSPLDTRSTGPTPSNTWTGGWTVFGGTVLLMVAVFQMLAGIVALADDKFYVVGKEWVFQFDATTWGWIHLLLGVVLAVSALGVFTGNVLARTIGVVFAMLSAIAAFMWLPYYPFWAFAILALDLAVIWGLTVHGRDLVD